ncbi:hypothetical protein [uncultured Bacteroides sp.]|uniref:hypothetical protein n=1 Tax=uncultured Bacteroides sp. TaxID=162156 RepID=UPI0025F5DB03|nr:hypothetical protein [uncultured Bacteroides sp.]
MKLNKKTIVTLTDFRRYFDLEQFWDNRRQFVRDMHPDKVYYWKDKDKECFQIVKTWIEMENSGNSNSDIRKNGLESLSTLTGKNITEEKFFMALGASDLNADIIYVQSGSSLKLPGKKVMTEEEAIKYSKSLGKPERLHKIEIKGDEEEAATIFINGIEVYKLPYGECVYITEVEGQYIRALPMKLEKGNLRLKLINKPGKFSSTLHLIRIMMGIETEDIHDVTQFSIFEGKELYSNNCIFDIYKQKQ